MKKKLVLIELAAVLAGTTPSYNASASGTYTTRPPQPKLGQRSFARADYSLGQRVFQGKAELDSAGDAPCQAERLDALQARLPDRVAGKKQLTALAGRLNSEQLNALEFYVVIRFTPGLESELYVLGQRILEGETPVEVEADLPDHQARLDVLQDRLPECLTGVLNLSRFSGRLTASQWAALEYHISQRFELKPDSKEP